MTTHPKIPLKKRHLSMSESNSSSINHPVPSIPSTTAIPSQTIVDEKPSLPGKKRWNLQIKQPTEPDVANSPPPPAGVSTLPSKKRWLKSVNENSSAKKKVSLTEYLQRKNIADNSDSDSFSCDGAAAKQCDKDVESAASNGVLNDLPIHSLEERKKELQKALSSMEERRKQQSSHSHKDKRKHKNSQHKHHKKQKHDKSLKEMNKKQIKEFSHFVKKQEKRLKSRQEAKAANTESTSSNGLSNTVNQFKLLNENLRLEIEKIKAQQINNNNDNKHCET